MSEYSCAVHSMVAGGCGHFVSRSLEVISFEGSLRSTGGYWPKSQNSDQGLGLPEAIIPQRIPNRPTSPDWYVFGFKVPNRCRRAIEHGYKCHERLGPEKVESGSADMAAVRANPDSTKVSIFKDALPRGPNGIRTAVRATEDQPDSHPRSRR